MAGNSAVVVAGSGAEAVVEMVANVVAGIVAGAAFSDAYAVASVVVFTIYIPDPRPWD